MSEGRGASSAPDDDSPLAAPSDRHFRTLVEELSLLAVCLDHQGHVVYCNPFLVSLTGWSLREVLGQSWFERFLPAEERDEVLQGFLSRLAAETIRPVSTHHVVTRQGERRLVRWHNSMLRDAEGRVVGTGSIGEDITDRVRAEEALGVQNAHLRQLFERSPLAIVLVDNADRVMDANPGFASLFGYEPGEMRGRSLNELIIPPQMAEEASRLSRSVLGGQMIQVETVRRHRDGTPIPVTVMGCPIELEGRQLGVYGIYVDNREQHRAEEALRRSEERYALAALGANDGLWDWDLGRGTIYFSGRWAAMVGLEERQLANDPEEWFSRVHPSDRVRLQREIEAHLAGESSHLQSEYRLRHRSGSFHWMLARGLAVRDAGGTPYRMAGSQTDITDRKQAESQLLHDALHDALTALPNRALFLNRLEMAIERFKRQPEAGFAVLLLDLDRFKVVNDTIGHRVGDALLVALGERLQRSLRVIDTAARLGGDEFGVLLEGVQDLRQAVRMADRLAAELETPFSLGGHEVFTSASIGIVVGGTHYDSTEQVMRDADIAMYRAKAQGKACYAIFDQEMHRRAVAEMRLEHDLRRALERQELELFYQPMVVLGERRLHGFEALVRWRHPERGLLTPGQFINMAEETGLIVPLGQWILRQACLQMVAWQAEGGAPRDLAISVNLSARQLANPDLPAYLAQTVAETGFDSAALELEITESMLMEDAAATRATLLDLKRDLGVKLSIDDFGTGYSSLSYLHQFPVDTLKVDRSFIARMNGGGEEEIVRAIVQLGRSLRMRVMAEGVETADQLARLERLECHLAQGFYFSPPVAEAAARQLLQRTRWE
ncbi:MAG TPA: EAL domain-containing protein [Thermoanaerobaculia bacterium]|nr:EAL domain-containing protein [Thermoanaerobaculia bacterium]